MLSGILTSSIIVAAVGGVVSIDRTAAFQTMVSRPLVAAPVVGYFLGNLEAALVIGAVLELLLIGDLPVGRYIP
ncbi:MAG TPA: PTS sugar transporter subunit IIC, partial [Thermodesulfobacteriota bacterium]|nr:PTS sugar transporter subunit IIC [Thermodesulfobacteriota bacterium]